MVIALTNNINIIVCLDGLFISKFYLLISLDTPQNAQYQTSSCNSRRIRNTFDPERFSCLARDTNSNKQ